MDKRPFTKRPLYQVYATYPAAATKPATNPKPAAPTSTPAPKPAAPTSIPTPKPDAIRPVPVPTWAHAPPAKLSPAAASPGQHGKVVVVAESAAAMHAPAKAAAGRRRA